VTGKLGKRRDRQQRGCCTQQVVGVEGEQLGTGGQMMEGDRPLLPCRGLRLLREKLIWLFSLVAKPKARKTRESAAWALARAVSRGGAVQRTNFHELTNCEPGKESSRIHHVPFLSEIGGSWGAHRSSSAEPKKKAGCSAVPVSSKYKLSDFMRSSLPSANLVKVKMGCGDNAWDSKLARPCWDDGLVGQLRQRLRVQSLIPLESNNLVIRPTLNRIAAVG